MAEAVNLKGELQDVSLEDIRSCWKVPAIAHFCSLFRSTFLLPDFEIEELEEALFLDAGVEQSDFITNLVVQLLRGIHGLKTITSEDYLERLRSVMKERWELGEKRVNPLINQDVTFKMLPTLTKVEILHALCDYRLDAADVTVLKDYDGDNLRVEPLGTDREGATYWYFYGTRLYKEDRQLTQEEKDAKHKQKLKEKRKKKKERLKAIKNMKEARKKQRAKVKKGKSKGSERERKKKKKSSKISDDESNNELVHEQGLQSVPNKSNKNAKKGQKRKNTKSEMKAISSNKQPKGTKSKKGLATDEVLHQRKKRPEDKSAKTRSKRQTLKKPTESNCKRKTSVPKKKQASEAETQQSTKNTTKKQSKTKKMSSSSSAKGGTKTNRGTPSQESPSKSRKRKVIKSKAIISDSEDDSDDDEPLKKLARCQISQKEVGAKANKQKTHKSNTICEIKRTNATNSRSKDLSKGSNAQEANGKKGKSKRLSTNTKKTKEVTVWSSEDDLSSIVSVPQSSDTDSDSEDDMEPPRWHLVCHSQEDWQRLTDFFKKSKVKCEKELYKTLANDFLPEIHSLFAAKEKALRKRLQELAPRRASSRVVIMQLKREEEERMKSIQEAEESSRRQQVEEEKRERMRLRSKSQQHPSQNEHVEDDKSSKASQSTASRSRGGLKKSKKTKAKNDNIHARLQQVYDAVGNHEDSWPFLDPVDEAYAPAYYQIIIKPMCLSLIQKKITKKDYKTKDEFERDMNQLFTNCLEYNGPGNEYTLMAENLKSCLEYNMDQIFPKQEVDIEENDSDATSSVSDHYVYQRPPQRQSARNANTRLEKLEDKVYARLRGLSSSESSIFESQDSSRVASDEEEVGVEKLDDGKVTIDHQDESDHCEDVKDSAHEEGEDREINLKQVPLTSADFVPSNSGSDIQDTTNDTSKSTGQIDASSKSTAMEASGIDDQANVQTSDEVFGKPALHTPSNKDAQDNKSVFKPRGVIAFAPGSSAEESWTDAHKNAHQKGQNQSCGDIKQESVQGSADVAGSSTSELVCKELHGQNLNSHLQGSHASKVNRVKPIQNVRPYIPDSHAEEDTDTMQSVPCDKYEPTQQTSEGRPAMIDLNSKRPDVLKPLTSSNETGASFHSENSFVDSLGLNQAIPQGNLYTSSSLSHSQHSKQFEHSGTKTKPRHTKTKSTSPPELPAPLTVLPVQESMAQHVPAVQPLLSSSNPLQVSHWHQDQSASSSGTFQQSGFVAQPTSRSSEKTMEYEPTQKLWHPLGFEAKADKLTSNPHTMANPDQSYLNHGKLPQASLGQSVQVHSQSGNILESLLHRQSHASHYQQPNYVSTNLDKRSDSANMCLMSGKQDDIIAKDRKFFPQNMDQLNRSSSESIRCREEPGQCPTDRERQPYRSVQPVYSENSLKPQRDIGLKTCMPSVYSPSPQRTVQLHHQQVEAAATNSYQSVVKHPENAILNINKGVAEQQKLAFTSHYPQSSSVQSQGTSQVDYGKDSISQMHIGQTERTRGIETMMPVRKSGSYISMLTPDTRGMKEYKDALDVRGYARPLTPYNQAHSSLYTDQLRMHASQASGASYAYPSGSHLSHLLPTRQTSGGQSSSAFTPHDPFSSHSAFRMQRPSHAIFPQYMGQPDAEHFARQQYQQHMHHRAGMGTGLAAYQPQSSHTHPDVAYYTQRGLGSALVGNQPISGIGAPMPYDPSLLSHPSHLPGYK